MLKKQEEPNRPEAEKRKTVLRSRKQNAELKKKVADLDQKQQATRQRP